jgi:ABC-type antimicrobial peptide transport system permease subunit
MHKYDLLKLLFVRLVRKQKFKLVAVILQIAMGIFIVIPALNITFYCMRTNGYFMEKFGVNTFILSRYTQNLQPLAFDQNEMNKIKNSSYIGKILIEHSSDNDDKNENIKNYLVDSNILAGEFNNIIRVFTTESNYSDFYKGQMIYGKFFSANDVGNANRVVVLSKRSSRTIFGIANGVGKEINVGDYGTFKVVGIIEDIQKNPYEEKMLDFYFPYTCFIGPSEDVVYKLYIKTTKTSNFQKDLNEIRRLIQEDAQDTIISLDSQTRDIMKELDDTKISSYIMLIFGLLLLVISYCGNVGISLSFFFRHFKIFGIEQALGATNGTIVKEILAENSIVYILGTILGISLSIPFKLYLNTINPLYAGTFFEWKTVLIVLGIAAFFTLLSSLFVIIKVKSYSVIELLRSERA